MDSLASFFRENEEKTNNLLIKAMYYSVGLLALYVIACIAGVFEGDVDKWQSIYTSLIDIVIVLFLVPLLKKRYEARILKYFIICTLTIIVLSLACGKNRRVYLTFLIPPLVSTFYLNDKFTLRSCIMAGIGYLISIASHCILEDDISFVAFPSRLSFFWAYGLGGIVELTLYSLILYYLTRTTFQSLTRCYLRKKRLSQIRDLVLDGFANIVESKDANTGEHIERTSQYVELICRKLQERNMFPDQVNDVTIPVMIRAAPFHDLGKISVPDDILNKPSRLDKDEWNVIQHHPADGALFIQHNFNVLNDDLFTKTASEMALCHHEHVDGTGYPYHLVGDEIPVSARIMAAADIFDALVSERAYKKAFSIDEAYKELEALSGTTLDPVIVECMNDARSDVERVMKEIRK